MMDDERRMAVGMGQPDDDGNAPAETDASAKPPSRANVDESDLGTALRAIYRRTVDEAVPPEMLDLLKRLD